MLCISTTLPSCLFPGVRMGSLGLFLQCVTSTFFSTIMDRMVKQFGTRAVYLASVTFFPLAAFVVCLSRSVLIVTLSAALTGFTFSALQILPYTLASLYHHDKQVGTVAGGRGVAYSRDARLGGLPAGSHPQELQLGSTQPEAGMRCTQPQCFHF